MYKFFIAFLLLLSFGTVKIFAQGYENDDVFNFMRKAPSYEEFKASKTDEQDVSPQSSSQPEEQKIIKTEEKKDVKVQNEPLQKIENQQAKEVQQVQQTQQAKNNNENEIQNNDDENKKFAYVYYNNVEIINLANRVSCSVNFNVKNETNEAFSGLELDLSWGILLLM
jgi:flagellar biosynthesis GTPase FlhF